MVASVLSRSCFWSLRDVWASGKGLLPLAALDSAASLGSILAKIEALGLLFKGVKSSKCPISPSSQCKSSRWKHLQQLSSSKILCSWPPKMTGAFWERKTVGPNRSLWYLFRRWSQPSFFSSGFSDSWPVSLMLSALGSCSSGGFCSYLPPPPAKVPQHVTPAAWCSPKFPHCLVCSKTPKGIHKTNQKAFLWWFWLFSFSLTFFSGLFCSQDYSSPCRSWSRAFQTVPRLRVLNGLRKQENTPT